MYIKELLILQKDNNKIAIKQGIRGVSYKEWYAESLKISEDIEKKMSEKIHNIAIFIPNSIEYGLAYFGITFCDKTIVPVGIQSKNLEVCSIVGYCELTLFLTTSENANLLADLLKECEYKVDLYCIDTHTFVTVNETKEYVKIEQEDEELTEKSCAIMLHTSGSTSAPKRVMLTHYSLINNVESNIDSLKLNENDVCLISIPMFFGYCNTAQFLTHIYLGASMVIMTGIFFPKDFFKTIQDEKVTNYTGVPSNLLMLLKFRHVDKFDYSSLRYICFGGGVMPDDGLRELISTFNTVGFVQTYGQTEASPRLTALLPEYSVTKLGSVGKAIKNVSVRVVNDDMVDCAANVIGEIIAQGPNIMRGYYKNESATNETIKQGWLFTGDLGYFDEDGFLYIVGRKKNIIISGGINIYPEEIEEVLLMHENIQEVIVYGEKDYLMGEIPVADVVLVNPDENVDLKKYCMEKLASYKIPTKFNFKESIKKTYNGKIQRIYNTTEKD